MMEDFIWIEIGIWLAIVFGAGLLVGWLIF